MRKLLTMFLLIISVGLLFAGAVSAAGTVDVAVLDEDGNFPINNATEGDNVTVGAHVDATVNGLIDPYVEITLDPETALEFDVNNARMTTDGINWIYNDDPVNGGFFFWYVPDQVWVWDIHDITGDMAAGEWATFLVPATVETTGPVTVNANLYQHMERGDVWTDNDTYTFLALSREPSDDGVPMQDTGAPLALAVLGLLGIAGGVVYGRIK